MTACSGSETPVRADRAASAGALTAEPQSGPDGEEADGADDGEAPERPGQAVTAPEIDEAEVENAQIADANLDAPFKDPAPPQDPAAGAEPEEPPPDMPEKVEGLQPADPSAQAGPAQEANLAPEHLDEVRWEAMTDREKRAARARAARKAYEQQ